MYKCSDAKSCRVWSPVVTEWMMLAEGRIATRTKAAFENSLEIYSMDMYSSLAVNSSMSGLQKLLFFSPVCKNYRWDRLRLECLLCETYITIHSLFFSRCGAASSSILLTSDLVLLILTEGAIRSSPSVSGDWAP